MSIRLPFATGSRTLASAPADVRTTALRVFGAAALALAALLAAARLEAAEEPVCAPRADIAGRLGELFAERPVALGLDAAGKLVEVFASPDGATWTMLATFPDGASCVVATGRFWQQHAPPVARADS